MNHDMAAKIMITDNSSGKDPRIAALENATLLGQYDFSNGWSIKVKLCDELNGYHIQFTHLYYGDGSYSCYKEIILWSCYYKNGEFMFAYYSESHYTAIPGDYRVNDDGIIYKSFERVTDFSEVTNFEVQQYYSNYYPFGVHFHVTLRGNEIETSYNSDGSVRYQVEETAEYTFDTTALGSYERQRWSNDAVFRKDYQTYINDILDFSYN